MRTSRSAATVTAVLALTACINFLATDTAWAVCGNGPKDPSGGKPRPAKHQGELQVTALKALPTQITAGGAAVELPVRITNRTDAAYEQVEPSLGLGHFYDMSVDLQLRDVKVSWKKGDGKWHDLALQPGCTRGIVNKDGALPMLALGKGESAELTYRIAVVASVPKALDTITYSANATGPDLVSGTVGGTLNVLRPKPATTAPAPRTTPPATPAATPVAVTAEQSEQSEPAAAPSQAPAPAELAETGSTTPNTFLLASAAAFIALGATVLTVIRRRTRR
ncbi:hypothetical protein [Kitasatospora sp. NPDC002040]|uniref:hypothetical protein n=1 Tax=Kitasatospora sp. NPDC002040 TaxID=3154661 RepID=UPI00331A94D6